MTTLTTFSEALVLLYVFIMLSIIMDIDYRTYTPGRRALIAAVVLGLMFINDLLPSIIGTSTASKAIILTMHLPFYILFYKLGKYGALKTLFIIFTGVFFTAPIVIVSRMTEKAFPDSRFMLFISNILVCIVIIAFIYFLFRESFHYLLRYGDNKIFLLLTVIPFVYYIYVFTIMNVDLSMLVGFSGLYVRWLPTLLTLSLYFLLIHVHHSLKLQSAQELAIVSMEQELDSAEKEISFLNESQKQTAMYQHDMRHHLNTIGAYLTSGASDKAIEYVNTVYGEIEDITPTRYCENEIVNLICNSFYSKAEKIGADFRVDSRFPGTTSLSDVELSSLLSNCLENALVAVSKVSPDDRWIELYSNIRKGHILIEIKNPYTGKVVIRNGIPVSNREGHGFGCNNIVAITTRHNGLCDFETEDNIFILRIMLPYRQ